MSLEKALTALLAKVVNLPESEFPSSVEGILLFAAEHYPVASAEATKTRR